MDTVARYFSPIVALRAVAVLRENGIPAWISAPAVLPPFEVHVFVGRADLAEPARRLLEAAPAESLLPEQGWEESSLPDLAQLDPALAPTCPSCNATLPLDASLRRCPSCSTEIDVAALLVERFGPELFDSIYEDPPEDESDADFQKLLANCHLACDCKYPLDGLGVAGRCPECGAPFHKGVMLRWMRRDTDR